MEDLLFECMDHGAQSRIQLVALVSYLDFVPGPEAHVEERRIRAAVRAIGLDRDALLAAVDASLAADELCRRLLKSPTVRA